MGSKYLLYSVYKYAFYNNVNNSDCVIERKNLNYYAVILIKLQKPKSVHISYRRKRGKQTSEIGIFVKAKVIYAKT